MKGRSKVSIRSVRQEITCLVWKSEVPSKCLNSQ